VQSQTLGGQVDETRGNKGHGDTTDDLLEPKVQGAILLQSLLRLNEPHNLLVTDRYA
jgi:nucleolar protein 9